MMIFWFVNVCMLLLALAFVLLPIIRRHHNDRTGFRNELNIHVHREHLQELESDFKQGNIEEEEFNNAKHELERNLLSDITETTENKDQALSRISFKTIIPIVVVLPVFVIVTYLMLGEIGMVNVQPQPAEKVSQIERDAMHAVDEMVANLSARLQEQPEDGEGWRMLARSYLVMDKYQDAVDAFRNARKYIGDDDSGLLADFSEALILSNNNRLTEEAANLLNLSLQANPDEPKALWMAGFTSYEQGDIVNTLYYWEHLLTVLPPDSEQSKSLKENINQIKQNTASMSTGKDVAVSEDINNGSDPMVVTETAEIPGTAIDVHVNLASTLLDKTNPEDTVFIFARASEGPRMPLAIVRKQVKDLPVKVTLDDSMAMTPGMTLSKFKQVIIGARVSKTGEAMPQSGDLSGSSSAIQPSEVTGVKVTIDQILP